jgi:type III secretion apparatus needle protein
MNSTNSPIENLESIVGSYTQNAANAMNALTSSLNGQTLGPQDFLNIQDANQKYTSALSLSSTLIKSMNDLLKNIIQNMN